MYPDQNLRLQLPPTPQRGGSTMTKLVIKLSLGLIKNERQASIVLLLFAIIIFLISIRIFAFGFESTKRPTPAATPTINPFLLRPQKN